MFKLVGTGHSGINELSLHVSDATVSEEPLSVLFVRLSPPVRIQVQFALLKFVFGSGSFARKKVLFLHLNGDACSLVARGRLNTKKGKARVRGIAPV